MLERANALPSKIQRPVGVLDLKQAVARSNSAERIHVEPAFPRRMVRMTDRKRAVLNVDVAKHINPQASFTAGLGLPDGNASITVVDLSEDVGAQLARRGACGDDAQAEKQQNGTTHG